jgi:hypothetical protein
LNDLPFQKEEAACIRVLLPSLLFDDLSSDKRVGDERKRLFAVTPLSLLMKEGILTVLRKKYSSL